MSISFEIFQNAHFHVGRVIGARWEPIARLSKASPGSHPKSQGSCDDWKSDRNPIFKIGDLAWVTPSYAHPLRPDPPGRLDVRKIGFGTSRTLAQWHQRKTATIICVRPFLANISLIPPQAHNMWDNANKPLVNSFLVIVLPCQTSIEGRIKLAS